MNNVFRLKVSTISGAGVGVFATHTIEAGTPLPELFGDDDCRWVTAAEFESLGLPEEIVSNFPIQYEDGYSLPLDFNRMSIGWYLNHGPPNIAHREWNYYALRHIDAGEELFIDYDQL